MAERFLITAIETPFPSNSLRRFRVQKGTDDVEVDVDRTGVHCQSCPAPLAHELSSCRHALAVKRRIASQRPPSSETSWLDMAERIADDPNSQRSVPGQEADR